MPPQEPSLFQIPPKLYGREREKAALLAAFETVSRLTVRDKSRHVQPVQCELEKNRKPSDADIDNAMAGNICRCATSCHYRGGGAGCRLAAGARRRRAG